MHIGGLRTALFCYLYAKKMDGTFILRIEDTDQVRLVEGAVEGLIRTLNLTGIHYDEGPVVGGDYGPYVQSERKEIYMVHGHELVANGHAYYCFCEKGEDAHSRENCAVARELPDGEKPFAIRHLIPPGKTSFVDLVFGEITVDNKEIEDQVLIKADGYPTYNFANVIDDHLMKITHIMRGTEFLPSVPKHKLLYEAFGWTPPTYVHLPLILSADGGKLSKRKGDAFFEDFIEKGFLVPALVNFIALLGFSPGGGKEIFSLDELVQIFDIKGLNKAPAVLDMQKLKWMNGEYIKALPFDEFYGLARPYLDKAVKRDDVDKELLAKIIQSRVAVLGEIAEMLDFVDTLPDYNLDIFINNKNKCDAETAKDMLTKVLPELQGLDENKWQSNEDIFDFIKDFVEAQGVKTTLVFWPLRCALSGKEASPGGATELLAAFGKEESLKRINIALEKLQ